MSRNDFDKDEEVLFSDSVFLSKFGEYLTSIAEMLASVFEEFGDMLSGRIVTGFSSKLICWFSTSAA